MWIFEHRRHDLTRLVRVVFTYPNGQLFALAGGQCKALGRYIISPFSTIELLPQDETYALMFAVFLTGSLIGISSLSALIHKIQQRAKDELQAVLIGFVFGSLFILWPPNRIANFAHTNSTTDATWAVIWGAVGLITVFALDYYERKK